MNQPTNFIWVTNQFIGFHRYKDAPDEVAYLREIHRHIFTIKVSIEIFHDDRDIEFHMFKTYINSLLVNDNKQLDNKSCEMISDDLYNEITVTYPNRFITIEISEDNENGSYKKYPKGDSNE